MEPHVFYVVDRDQLAPTETAHEFEGHRHGSGAISFIQVDAPPGAGASLHRHPYEEVFVIQEGRGTFTVGDAEIEAGAGQVVIVSPGTPHGFVNPGPGRLRQIDIHASPRFITDWLDDKRQG